MRIVFLVGMPGAGKTHWGRLWSKAAGCTFFDLDDEVSSIAGLAIPDIFRSVGETGFRTLEAVALLDTIAAARDSSSIIATGGGTPAFDRNMDVMLRTGCVVYLRAGIETLHRQISGSGVARPLLEVPGADPNILQSLLERRRPHYERAHFTYDVEQLHTDTFAQITEACIKRQ